GLIGMSGHMNGTTSLLANSTLTTTNGLSSSVTVETDNSSKNVMGSTSITDGNANSTNNNNASSSVTPTSIV
ncbi:26230_t:CDS:1, partial [Racocetra persica]